MMRAVSLAMMTGPLLAATACAPTLPQLVQHKHYREALCAVVDEGDDDGLVGDALVDDANLHAHVHRVTEAELMPVLGEDATRAVSKRAAFVRVRLQSNAIPTDAYAVRVAFESDGPHAGLAAPADWRSLAYATDERLPPDVRGSTYMTGGNLLKGAAAVFTVGLSLIFTGGFKPGTRLYQAPRSHFLQQAPLATSLHDAMVSRSQCSPLQSTTHQQKRCELFFVLEAHPDIDWALRVDEAFGSRRVTVHESDADAVCQVERTRFVPIGDPATTFGTSMKPVADLAAP